MSEGRPFLGFTVGDWGDSPSEAVSAPPPSESPAELVAAETASDWMVNDER